MKKIIIAKGVIAKGTYYQIDVAVCVNNLELNVKPDLLYKYEGKKAKLILEVEE